MSVRPRHRRWLPAAAFSAVLALLVSGCSAPTEQRAEPEPVAQGLQSYYEQQMQWEKCGSVIECATLKVPLDYENPQDGSIDLALNRRVAQGSEKNLLVNPGGPGGSGLDLVKSSVPLMFSKELQREYNVIGFDPRGVGKSTPVTCLDDAEQDELRQQNQHSWVPAEREEIRAESKKYADSCLEKTGELLGHVDTASAAKDMDIIREALGDEQLDYLGFSYGTFLGATYADLFPGHAGRMVLDGAMDPKSTSSQVDLAQAVGFEKEIKAWLEDCVESGDCPFTGTAEDAYKQLQDFFKKLEAKPMVASDGRKVPVIDFINGFIIPLYESTSWPMLSSAMADALEGDVDQIQYFADLSAGRDEEGNYTGNTTEAFGAVTCLDYPMDAAEARMEAEASELQRQAPIIGKYLSYGALGCEDWPFEPTRVPGELHADGAGDILVIGTTGDPATPYHWSESLAKQLQGGVLLTYEGHGHTAYGRSNDCVTQAVDGYLIDGQVPEDGTKC